MRTPKKICMNMNHGRMNISIRFCPTCGESLNPRATTGCSESDHASRRRDRDAFCIGCGKSLKIAPSPKPF